MILTNEALPLLISSFLFVSSLAPAQSENIIEIGSIDSVYSDILKESREFYVQLPESFQAGSKRKYPVIYLLDGASLMDAATTVYNYYWGGFMPEMVIIGISNRENRTRDLTTSEIEYRRGAEFTQENGGAEIFTAFMEEELIPHIEANYPVTGYRTLIGHSYAGLFTINALIGHSDLFANYLAIDPSLDWDEQKLQKEAMEAFGNRSFSGKSLFISLGGQLHMQNYEINIDNVMQDTSEYSLFARSNIEFSTAAEANPQNDLNFEWKYYPRDLHGTVPLPSILDGLIFLFDWFQMEHTDKFNSPDTPIDELIQIIRAREKKLSAHFGYFVPPYDEELLNMLGYMNLEMGLKERSLAFFLLGIEYFPLSANAFDSLADYYVAQNDFQNALKYVSTAYELSGSEYHKERIAAFTERIESTNQ